MLCHFLEGLHELAKSFLFLLLFLFRLLLLGLLGLCKFARRVLERHEEAAHHKAHGAHGDVASTPAHVLDQNDGQRRKCNAYVVADRED